MTRSSAPWARAARASRSSRAWRFSAWCWRWACAPWASRTTSSTSPSASRWARWRSPSRCRSAWAGAKRPAARWSIGSPNCARTSAGKLARDCRGDRADHLGLLADRRLEGDLQVREFFLDGLDLLGEVLLQVAPESEKNRHDPQLANSLSVKRCGALVERGLHQFEEGEHDALAGQPFAELCYELLERPRPFRITRAVGEEDDCTSRHAAIIAESRYTSPSRISAGPPEPAAATDSRLPSVPKLRRASGNDAFSTTTSGVVADFPAAISAREMALASPAPM